MSLTPGARQLARDRQVAGLRHAGGARRSGILQDQKIVRRDVEVRIVDARREILQRGEHDRAAFALEQAGSAAERFRIAPRGARLPNSATSPPFGSIGLVAGRTTAPVDEGASSAASRSPSVSPVTVMQSRWSSGFSSRSTAPMPPAAWKSSM